MASLAPFVPGLEINTRYARATTPQTANLLAYIIGPSAEMIRYDNVDERELGNLGQYDSVGTLILGAYKTVYAWPELSLGSEIDDDYVRLHVKNGRLRYWTQAAGTMTRTGLNRIKHPTKAFIANGVSYPVAADFGDRGVRVGDRVRVAGLAGADPFVLHTYVQGFAGDLATPAGTTTTAVVGNQGALTAAAVVTADGFNSGDVTATSSAASFSGAADNVLTDTYTITVTQASTGGDATTALLSVTTASGRDQATNVVPAAFASPTTIGTKGLTVTFAATGDFTLGESWVIAVTQPYAVPVLTMVYSYDPPDSKDREYLIEVIQGGQPTGAPVLRVTELSGLDQTVTVLPYSGGVFVPFAVGSYGVMLDELAAANGFILGDRWIVTVKAAIETHMRTLILAHSLPSAVLYDDDAVNLAVELYIGGDREIPARSEVEGDYNFVANDFELGVNAEIELIDPTWTVSGTAVPLPLVVPGGTTDTSILYVTYRAWLPRSEALLSFQDPSALATLLGGPAGEPDNPLKYALTKAALVADGRPVYYFNTGNPSNINNWSVALAAADGTRETYGFVPLTRDPAVLDLVAGHVNSRSGPLFNMPRVAWFTNEDATRQAVLSAVNSTDAAIVLATIADNPDQSGTQYTLVEVTTANADFVARGVRAGDTLRYNFSTNLWGDVTYDEYTIASVLNESTLIISSGPLAAESIGKRMEIHRVLTPAERVLALTGNIDAYTGDSEIGFTSTAGRYPGQLYRFLFSGYVLDGSRQVPSYFMAATLAAYRGALAPHQALTRLPVPGFNGVVGIGEFNDQQLNEIAGSGGFLVVRDVRTGQLAVRHGITSGDFDNVNIREESIHSNVDSIKGYLFTLLDPYIGQTSATDETLAMIDSELVSARGFLRSANYSPGLGGQLIDMQVVDRRVSPVAKDSLLISVEITVPGPTNRIRVDLLVI